jgi:hypothetical protein
VGIANAVLFLLSFADAFKRVCCAVLLLLLQARYDKYRVGTRLGTPAELLKRYGNH